jgi:hypothetical protein
VSQVEAFISRLDKVKGRNGSWTACCPAHKDKSPSLSIREGQDGRVLVHCFAGCSVHEVVGAVGMSVNDLFPPDEKRKEYGHAKPSVKASFYSSDLMRIIGFESLVVQIAAIDMANGKKLSDTDRERLAVASQRIQEAMRYGNV